MDSPLEGPSRTPFSNRTNVVPRKQTMSSSVIASTMRVKKARPEALAESIRDYFFESTSRGRLTGGEDKSGNKENERQKDNLENEEDWAEPVLPDSEPSIHMASTSRIHESLSMVTSPGASRLSIGPNEHCQRLLPRSLSAYEESPSRKRSSTDVDPSERATRRRSSAIQLNQDSFDVFLAYNLELVPSKDCKVRSVAFGCISAETLIREWDLLGDEAFKMKYLVIDCRYPYEYEGGHIKNAINLHDDVDLNSIFFPKDSNDEEKSPKKIPIFYCEYSQKRGPRMAHALRKEDRIRNIDHYPNIEYEVMYLLDQGYRNFFRLYNEKKRDVFSDHCSYVEMEDKPEKLGVFRAHRRRRRAAPLSITPGESTVVDKDRTPGINRSRRQASLVAQQRIRDSHGGRLALPDSPPLSSAKARLTFDSDDEKDNGTRKEE